MEVNKMLNKARSFKIYTERLNEDKIKELLAISFDGSTIIHTKGQWKGQEEDSIIVEIITANRLLVEALADKIKRMNRQEAVLVTSCAVDFELI
jgi:hypothetical protein